MSRAEIQDSFRLSMSGFSMKYGYEGKIIARFPLSSIDPLWSNSLFERWVSAVENAVDILNNPTNE